MNVNEIIRGRNGVLFELAANDHHVIVNYPPTEVGVHGVTLGYASPPRIVRIDDVDPATEHLSVSERRFLQDDASAREVAKALSVVDAWGVTIKRLAADENLSGNGKLRARVEAALLALSGLGTHYGALEEIRIKLERRHAEVFAVPPADAAAAIVDVEIRQELRGIDPTRQAEVLLRKDPRLILALMRSPLPIGNEHVEKIVHEAWTAQVVSERPKEAGALALEESMNAWARGIVQFLGENQASPNLNGTSGALARFEVYKLLRQVGGVGLLKWMPDEANGYERRIAVAA